MRNDRDGPDKAERKVRNPPSVLLMAIFAMPIIIAIAILVSMAMR
jgi:hypothetical protein